MCRAERHGVSNADPSGVAVGLSSQLGSLDSCARQTRGSTGAPTALFIAGAAGVVAGVNELRDCTT